MKIFEFQLRVAFWVRFAFGSETAMDKIERHHRFLEEALELVQSTGCTKDEAHELVEYVYARPVGDPAQEVGGVMLTLAALCWSHDLLMDRCGLQELNRVYDNIDQIRAKQAAKPKHGPLPGPTQEQKT